MFDSVSKIIGFLDQRARWQLAGLSVLAVIGSGFEVCGIGLVFGFVKLLIEPALIATIPTLQQANELMDLGSPKDFLIFCAIILIALFLVKNLFMAGFVYIQMGYVLSQAEKMSIRMLRAYVYCPYIVHLQRNSSELISNTRDVVFQTFNTFVFNLITFGVELFVTGAIALFLFTVEPIGSISAVISISMVMAALHVFLTRRFVVWGEINVELITATLKALQQALGGAKETKVMGCEDSFIDVYWSKLSKHVRMMHRRHSAMQLPRFVFEAALVTGILLVATISLSRQGNSGDVMASLALFAAAGFRLMPSATRINAAWNVMKTSAAGIDLLHEDIVELEDPDSVEKIVTNPESIPFKDEIVLKECSYAYPGEDEMVLNEISIRLEKFQSLGIVGPSGAGKTTLADILLGLLLPTKGKLLVDGMDTAIEIRRWQRIIGYVPQTIFLLDATLRQNVAFGIDEDEIDDEEFRRAIELAHLDEFVATLADGVETELGENGIRLSGGQRQRVGIARALYRDPEVLIMDEATSSLDSETESEITKAIQELSGKKTVIVIAHRFSTVHKCDELLFLKDGRVQDHGPFSQLMKRNTEFRRMVKLGTVTDAPAIADESPIARVTP